MVSMVRLESTALRTIQRHALRDHPAECCGIFVGHVNKVCFHIAHVVEARNIAEGDRRRRFQVDWQTLFRTVKSARGSRQRIVGFYHSHPDGGDKPSETDLEYAWREHAYLILPIVRGEAGSPTAWFLGEAGGGFRELKLA